MKMLSHAVSRADGKKSLIYTYLVLIIAVAVGYYSYVKQEELQNVNKCEKINLFFSLLVLF